MDKKKIFAPHHEVILPGWDVRKQDEGKKSEQTMEEGGGGQGGYF